MRLSQNHREPKKSEAAAVASLGSAVYGFDGTMSSSIVCPRKLGSRPHAREPR